MNDAGYTLTETLAAMAVIGMAIGGLTLGAQVLGSLQLSTGKAVSQLQSVRLARRKLEQLMALGAPFGSAQPDQLSGDPTGFHFQCGAVAPCTAEILTTGRGPQLKVASGDATASSIVLPLSGPARFVYRGSTATSDTWPPPDGGREFLRSVTLLQTTQHGEAALVEAKVWAEERAECAFDPIIQDCR